MSESANPAALPKVRIATTRSPAASAATRRFLTSTSAYSNYVDEASPGRDIGVSRPKGFTFGPSQNRT